MLLKLILSYKNHYFHQSKLSQFTFCHPNIFYYFSISNTRTTFSVTVCNLSAFLQTTFILLRLLLTLIWVGICWSSATLTWVHFVETLPTQLLSIIKHMYSISLWFCILSPIRLVVISGWRGFIAVASPAWQLPALLLIAPPLHAPPPYRCLHPLRTLIKAEMLQAQQKQTWSWLRSDLSPKPEEDGRNSSVRDQRQGCWRSPQREAETEGELKCFFIRSSPENNPIKACALFSSQTFMVSVLWSDESEVIIYRSFQDFRTFHVSLRITADLNLMCLKNEIISNLFYVSNRVSWRRSSLISVLSRRTTERSQNSAVRKRPNWPGKILNKLKSVSFNISWSDFVKE